MISEKSNWNVKKDEYGGRLTAKRVKVIRELGSLLIILTLTPIYCFLVILSIIQIVAKQPSRLWTALFSTLKVLSDSFFAACKLKFTIGQNPATIPTQNKNKNYKKKKKNLKTSESNILPSHFCLKWLHIFQPWIACYLLPPFCLYFFMFAWSFIFHDSPKKHLC